MNQTAAQYAPLLLFLFLVLMFAVFTINVGILFRPRRPRPEKSLPYECGMDPVGPGNVPILPRYWFYAVLLVLFDVEAVFLIPWALHAAPLGVYGLAAVFVFFLVLALGYLYLWRMGDLEWD